MLSASAESIQKRPSIRRTNSRDKRHYLHRSSSRRNKENGSRSSSFKTKTEALSRSNSYKTATTEGVVVSRSNSNNKGRCLCRSGSKKGASSANGDDASTPVELQTLHVTLTYKPRI